MLGAIRAENQTTFPANTKEERQLVTLPFTVRRHTNRRYKAKVVSDICQFILGNFKSFHQFNERNIVSNY